MCAKNRKKNKRQQQVDFSGTLARCFNLHYRRELHGATEFILKVIKFERQNSDKNLIAEIYRLSKQGRFIINYRIYLTKKSFAILSHINAELAIQIVSIKYVYSLFRLGYTEPLII